MTPQERQLVDELFDKLAHLETAPRDANAAAVIADGSRRAPNALYALVQTVLLQDEALKRANEHIQQLENGGQAQQPPGGFLDSMRDSLFGGGNRGSVPSVKPADANSRGPTWNSGQVLGQTNGGYGNGGYAAAGYGGPGAAPGGPAPAGGGGSSFLGTAAAAAAGMIGGTLLMNSMRGMFGGGQQHGFGDQTSLGKDTSNPWGGSSNNDLANSDLARDAGLNDIGKGGNAGSGSDTNSRQGFFDQASNDDNDSDDDSDDDGFDSDDFGGGGDTDFA